MSVRVELTPDSLRLAGVAAAVLPLVARAVELGFDIEGHTTVEGEFAVDLSVRSPLPPAQVLSLREALADASR